MFETRAHGRTPTPLRDAPRLVRLPAVSPQDAALLREFYGHAALQREVAGVAWRFRWAAAPTMAATTLAILQLRIGGAAIAVGIVDAGPFPVIAQALRPELPATLRAAYLGGSGAALWGALESATNLAVTLEDVQDHAIAARAEPCLGFELARGTSGPALRGFVRANDAAAWRVLRDACGRAMTRRPLPADLPVRWAAVVGHTALDAAEAAALVADDIVLIDDAQCTPDALHCRLVAGAGRHPAGRVSLQQSGLQLMAFDRKGHTAMDKTPPQPAPIGDTEFDAIQVNLRFEIARWHAPLAELATLAPGAVIDIGRSIDEPVVSVWADERCIGQGQLVAIGDRLGVRLMSVYGKGLPGANQTRASLLPAGPLPTVVATAVAPVDAQTAGQAG